MSQEKLEINSQEEVAYKLMQRILPSGKQSEELVLKTFEKCLQVVKGSSYEDLD